MPADPGYSREDLKEFLESGARTKWGQERAIELESDIEGVSGTLWILFDTPIDPELKELTSPDFLG